MKKNGTCAVGVWCRQLAGVVVLLTGAGAWGGEIIGLVTNQSSGTPVYDAIVEAVPAGGAQAEFSARTTRQGGFQLPGLAGGTTYLLRVTHAFHGPAQTSILVGALGTVTQSFGVGEAAPMQGRIRDSTDALPVEGAVIRAVPAGQTSLLYSAESDAFGFYGLNGLPAGEYQVSVSQPAYVPSATQTLSTAGGGLAASFDLVRQADFAARAEVHVNVRCAVSSIPAFDVPVRLRVYESPTGGALLYDETQTTQARGGTVFRGVPFGFFEMRCNNLADGAPNGWWQAYDPGTRTALNQAKSVTFHLEPYKRAFTIRVVPEESWMRAQPYLSMYAQNFWVEIQGQDPEAATYPARTGITDFDGEVLFEDVPSVPCRVTIRRVGFELESTELTPDAAGEFPAETEMGRPPVQTNTGLVIVFDVPGYASFTNCIRSEGVDRFTLRGLEKSNSSGYFRLFEMPDPWTNAFRKMVGLSVGDPWAGTYELTGVGNYCFTKQATNSSYGICFNYVVPPTIITMVAGQITTNHVPLQIKKAHVRGRLLLGETTAGDGSDIIYQPVSNKTIQFIIHSDIADLLPPSAQTNEVITDDAGEYELELWPAIYGIRLPDRPGERSLAAYWGERIFERTPYSQKRGWPYTEPGPEGWSYSSKNSDYVMTRGWTASSEEYAMDLFVRARDNYSVRGYVGHKNNRAAFKERVCLVLTNHSALTCPTDEFIESGSQVVLKMGGVPVASGVVHKCDNRLSYVFTNLAPGTYTVHLDHPRYAQDTNITFRCFAWNSPGVLPAEEPPTSTTLIYRDDLLPLAMNSFAYGTWGSTLSNKLLVTRDNPALAVEDNQLVTINYLEEGEIKSYQVAPAFARCSEYGARLFKYSGYIFPEVMDYVVLHDRYGPVCWFQPTGRVVNVWEDAPTSVNAAPYTLEVLARQEAMREIGITGLNFRVQNDTHLYETPRVFAGHTGDATLSGPATNSNWTWKFVNYELSPDSITSVTPHVIATVYANLIFDLRGQLVSTVGSGAVTDAQVDLVRSDGGRLEGIAPSAANSNGMFTFTSIQEGFRDYFVEVAAPGFLPTRVRFSPGPPPPYTGSRPVLELPAPIALTPVPLALRTNSFNRFGHILGGVRAVGEGETNTIEMTWSAAFESAHGTYSLLSYDNANGSTNPPVTRPYSDRVTEIWLVDGRFNPFQWRDVTISEREATILLPDDAGLPPGQRYPTAVTRLPPPNNPALVRHWLRNLSEGFWKEYKPETGYSDGLSPQTIFSRRLTNIQAAPGDVFSATGTICVADLPRGEFRPVIAAITEMGASAYYPVTFGEKPPLHALRLPTWLAFAADLITMGGQYQGAISELKETYASKVPAGKFSAIPEITGGIVETNGFLNYAYGIKVKWLDGTETPGSGLLALAPGLVGIEFESDAAIDFEGEPGALGFAVAGKIGKSGIDLKRFAPNIMEGLGIEGEITEISGEAETRRSVALTGEQWMDYELMTRLGANLEGYMRYNLSGLTGKLPYVGPVLLVADKSGLLSFYARGDMGIRLSVQEVWRTIEPERRGHAYLIYTNGQNVLQPPAAAPVIDPPPMQPDDAPLTPTRHCLGGQRNVSVLNSNITMIGFNFGASLEAEALGGRLYGRAGLALTGNEETQTVNGKPSLIVIPNKYGDWPVVRRVMGEAQLQLEAKLDLTITELKKTWSWPLIQIDAQFGTDPFMRVDDLGITVRETAQGDFASVELAAAGPILLDHCLWQQRYDMCGNILAYLSYDADRDLFTLLVADESGGGWSIPVEVATAAQFLAIRVIQLPAPDGRWMLVWGDVPASDISKLQPRCTLRYSIREPGGWTAPGLVAQLDGQLRDLEPVYGGGFVSLFYLENPDGFLSFNSRLMMVGWGGSAWQTPYVIRSVAWTPAATAAGLGAGSMAPARIGYIATNADLSSRYWDGLQAETTNGLPEALVHAGPAVSPMAMCATATNQLFLAWQDADRQLRLHRHMPVPGAPFGNPDYDWNAQSNMWTDLGAPLPTRMNASEMRLAQLVNPGTSTLLLAWTDGAQIRHAWLDPASGAALGPFATTTNAPGRYRDLRIVPGSNLAAQILARYSTTNRSQVRRFDVTYGAGSFADSDSDGMNDVDELNVVDAAGTGAITRVAGVLPGADFDGDGYSNMEEIAAGSDPVNPRSMPPVDGVEVVTGYPDAYEDGPIPGSFMVQRAASDSTNAALRVYYTVAGTATAGVDYVAIGTSVVIQAGASNAMIEVTPIMNSPAAGIKTVILMLRPDAAYTLGRHTNATVNIHDSAFDTWRADVFTPEQLADPAISGPDADPDGDDLPNLMEYAMGTNPLVADQPPFRFSRASNPEGIDLAFTTDRNAVETDLRVDVIDNLSSNQWTDNTAGMYMRGCTVEGTKNQVVLSDTNAPMGTATNRPERFYRLRAIR